MCIKKYDELKNQEVTEETIEEIRKVAKELGITDEQESEGSADDILSTLLDGDKERLKKLDNVEYTKKTMGRFKE